MPCKGFPPEQLTNDHEPACMCHLYRLRINTHVLTKHHDPSYRATRVCMVKGVCMVVGGCGCGGSICGCSGACMAAGDMRGCGEHGCGGAWLQGGMHGCGGASMGYDEIRSMSGWYPSYWNAFLL